MIQAAKIIGSGLATIGLVGIGFARARGFFANYAGLAKNKLLSIVNLANFYFFLLLIIGVFCIYYCIPYEVLNCADNLEEQIQESQRVLNSMKQNLAQ
jgi:hypothetical protein